jgi:hypothetical protein
MKTVWPGMDQMITDYNTLERNLRDMRTVIACICLQQDDKTFSVPFDELKKVPNDAELEVSVDRVHGNYVFTLVGADGIRLDVPDGNKEPGSESPGPALGLL